jgi:hypothetical protein
VILDAEKIIGDYLRAISAVSTLGARVVPKTPSDISKPWIRVTLLDPANATGTTQTEWLVGYYLQLDCYAGAGGRPEAFKLAQAARNALVGLPGTALEEAVATDVEFLSMPRIPDVAFDDDRERYIIDTIVHLHPKP